MTSDEPVESQGAPAESGGPASASSTGGESRPQGERRGRFRRGGRGGRGRRGGRGGSGGGGGRQEPRPAQEHAESASPSTPGPSGPPGNIKQALDLAVHIQSELERALEDINEILRILEQADREKNASEDEIERLHESLHRLQHGRGPSRPQHYSKPAAAEESSHSRDSEKSAPEPEVAEDSAPEGEEGDDRD